MSCELKISFKIGSVLRCVKYVEKKPNLTILTSLKSQIFFINDDNQETTQLFLGKWSPVDKPQMFPQIDVIYHYWWAWLSILSILKVTSFQYLYNISKKKLGMEFNFCMQINIKVSTSWDNFCRCPKYQK